MRLLHLFAVYFQLKIIVHLNENKSRYLLYSTDLIHFMPIFIQVYTTLKIQAPNSLFYITVSTYFMLIALPLHKITILK